MSQTALEVTVKIGADLKKSYDEELKRIERARGEGASAWHELYLATARVLGHDPPMYMAAGHTTDAEFLEAVLGETRQAAYRNIRVAKLSTAAEVAEFSATKLHYGITYVEAKTGETIGSRKDLDFATLRIELEADGKTLRKSFAKATYAELHKAIAQLSTKPKSKQSAEAKAILEALKRSGVKGASATVTRKNVTLRAPLDGLQAIIHELSGFTMTPKS